MMRTSHILALVSLMVWCALAVWLGADSFGVGECAAIALIWAGLWVVFALLKAVNERKGRMRWSLAPCAVILGLACNARRPRVSEVSCTYDGSMRSLAVLAEVVRWR